MRLLIASIVLAQPAPAAFPEHVPGLIRDCLTEAIDEGHVSETEDSHKYMCGGEAAERFWIFLEQAHIGAYEQDAGVDGFWLTRLFPLGGCFKAVRMADGSPATEGLSCSVWIPRPTP